MFAAKTTNRGKLDSHCWFFDGFAYLLQPDFCVLFDAGEGRLMVVMGGISEAMQACQLAVSLAPLCAVAWCMVAW